MLNMSYIEPLLDINSSQPGFFQKLIQVYTETSLCNIDNIKDALINEDLSKIKKEAHSLKSSSLSLGLDEVSNLCLFLEKEIMVDEQAEVQLILEKIQSKNLEGLTELSELCKTIK